MVTRVTSASEPTTAAPKKAPFYVPIPRASGRKIVSAVRLLVLAVAGLAALVAALIAMDAALLGDSRRKR